MMRHFSRASVFSMIAMGSLSMAPVSFAQQASVSTVQAEHARREMAVREAYQAVQEARLAYVARRYSDAVELYKEALASVPSGESTKKLEKFIRDSLSDALIAKALDYRLVGRRDEAISFLQEALKYAPDNKRAEVELGFTLDPVRTNPALTPQHIAEVEEVKRLLELGYGHLDLGKYDDAIAVFKSISQYDAYNSAAQQGIEAALKRKSAALQASHNATRAGMLADVDALWLQENKEALPEIDGNYSEELHPVDSEIQEVYATGIAEVMIPNIVLEDADIMEVIEALQLQIRASETEGKLNLSRKINITTNFGPADSKGYKDITSRTVNLKLRDVSVKEVLDILVSQLGISYYYTTAGVEISFSGKDFGPLIDRTFTVPPHFFDASAEEESDDEDDAFEEDSGRITVHRVNPVQSLKGMGVSFPEGATARYSASSRQLFVRNTSYNLEEIQDLLNEPLTEQRQVVLNVIVMEIAENDLEQLGFDWMFNVNLNGEFGVGGGAEQAASTATGMPVFGSVVQGSQATPSVTSGLRSGTAVLSPDNMEHLISSGGVSDYSSGASLKSPSIFGIRGVWSAVDVTVIMNGLAQRKGVDILRNPRLIFSPGLDEQVSFADVTEMFFPETWEPSEIASFSGFINNGDDNNNNSSSGSSIATGATPSDFVRFGMSEDGIGGFGTILQVHSAEISENGQFVTLALTTTTNEFEGFINWGTPINSAIWDGSGQIEYYQLSPNYILQPMIKRYVENTKITLVPGSVMVMGGLKEAKQVRFEDKVPVLGDLPLVGRLFRSEGEQKIRKALIYFVKVDLVDPTGRDVKTGERPSSFTDNY